MNNRNKYLLSPDTADAAGAPELALVDDPLADPVDPVEPVAEPESAEVAEPEPETGDSDDFVSFDEQDGAVTEPEVEPAELEVDAPAPEPDPSNPVQSLSRNLESYDLTPEELALVKPLRNYAYDRVKPLLEQITVDRAALKQSQADLAEARSADTSAKTFYDQPDAYTLTPQWKRLDSQFTQVEQEQAYYRQQAITLKDGGAAQLIQGYNEKGQAVLGPEVTGSAAEVDVQTQLGRLANQEAVISGQAETLQSSFKQSYQTATQSLDSFGASIVNRLPENIRPTVADIESIKTQFFPPEFAAHPVANFAAGALKVISLISESNQSLMKERDTLRKVQNDEELAGVKPRKTKVTAPKADDDDFVSFDDLGN